MNNKTPHKIVYPNFILGLKKKYGQKTAITENKVSITYEELIERACAMGNAIISDGLEAKDRVMLQLDNSILFSVSLFAILLAGGIPVLVYPACRKNEILSIAETSQPKMYISFRNFKGFDYIETAKQVFSETSSISRLYFSDELEELISRGDKHNISRKYIPSLSDTAVIVLSGGSTGIPKLIARKHSEHITAAELCAESCGLDSDSVFLLAMPAAHNFNLVGPGLIGTLAVGGRVVMCRNSNPSEITTLIESEKVTATALVPSLAQECILYAKNKEVLYSFDSLKIVQLGGAVCPEETIRMVYRDMGCIPQQIYGMGEGIIFATFPDDSLDVITRYQGRNLSGYDEVKIIDEAGNPLSEGEYGEVIAKGPSILTEYYNSAGLYSEKFTSDGYYRTGDIASVQNGYIHVVGRKDDMINKGGEKIYPAEVEEYINKCKGVVSSAVIGCGAEGTSKSVFAFVIADNKEVSASEIRNQLNLMGIAVYKIPDEFVFLEEWPLTSVNKIDKKVLRSLAEEKLEGRKSDGSVYIVAVDGMDDIESAVANIWAECLETSDIDMSISFLELGGTSILIGRMLGEIEKRFSVSIGIDEFYSHHELNEFVGLIKSRLDIQ